MNKSSILVQTENDRLPRELTVKQASSLIGMTQGGLRGAILRGKLPASKDEHGRLLILSHNLAAYHLYGKTYPEDQMKPSTRATLHIYLETLTRV
jgi:hypothetical protein